LAPSRLLEIACSACLTSLGARPTASRDRLASQVYRSRSHPRELSCPRQRPLSALLQNRLPRQSRVTLARSRLMSPCRLPPSPLRLVRLASPPRAKAVTSPYRLENNLSSSPPMTPHPAVNPCRVRRVALDIIPSHGLQRGASSLMVSVFQLQYRSTPRQDSSVTRCCLKSGLW